MQTPLVLELLAPRIHAQAGAPAATLRLPPAAWTALLSALDLDPHVTALPGTATVAAQLPGDAYRIEYAGRAAELAWPQRLVPGMALHLARTPLEPLSGSAPARTDSAHVSETVETLSRLLDRAFREPPRPFALALDAPPSSPAPQRFAAALADAISGSGVFFESHLAEWVQGKRSLGEIRLEADTRTTVLAPAADVRLPVSEAALQQQLSLLVTSELAFQFPAWPGQPATLSVGPGEEDGSNDAGPEREFVAHLETSLRRLGGVHATLNLNSNGIDLALRADSPDTAAAMRGQLASLAQALRAAGLKVSRIEVSNERPA